VLGAWPVAVGPRRLARDGWDLITWRPRRRRAVV